MGLNPHYVIDLSQVYREEENLVGKKAYELGMLWELGIPLPKGFVITNEFFKEFLRTTRIEKEIEKVQSLNHPAISSSIGKMFEPIQKQIMIRQIPQDLAIELHKFYRNLSGMFKNKPLNVFSSSFNNKSIIFSNIKGDANLIFKIKTIWSLSLEESVAIIIQENILPDVKGKLFTDSPTVDKKLTKQQMDKLINYCCVIQKHFYFPYEIEYIVRNSKVFITKVNPFTGVVIETPKPVTQNKKQNRILIKGVSINPGIVTGPIKILRNIHDAVQIKKGEIVVLHNLELPIFKKIKNAKAIITDSVLSNSLNKTLYRKDFQIPTVEGTKNATKMFQDGNIVTVNGISGEIYSGGLIY